MAGTTTWRRRALAAVALATLALTGCGSKDPGTPSSSNQTPSGGSGELGGAPSASATGGGGATTTSGGGSGGGGGGNAAPTYPKDAKAYTQELLKAMAKPDYTRISQLAVQAAVQQVKDSINGTGGNPNSSWPYVNCTAAGASATSCVARNNNGDQLTVGLNNTQLGFPTAVTEALLDRTTYPNDPGNYVTGLLDGAAKGNQQRVLRLSNDSVKGKVSCDFGKQISVTMIDSTYSKVTVDGLGVDLGKKYEFKVLTAPGGKANAVKEVLAKQC
jgi:hypothetical protein